MTDDADERSTDDADEQPTDDAEERPAEDWSLDADDDDADTSESAGSAPPAESTPSDPPVERTDSDAPQSDANTTEDPTDPMSSTTRSDLVDAARLRQLLEYGLLAVFVLVALFAALGFYSQVGRAIEIWVADAYEPIAKATVNLALLLIAVAGVSHQLARLAGRGSGDDGGAE